MLLVLRSFVVFIIGHFRIPNSSTVALILLKYGLRRFSETYCFPSMCYSVINIGFSKDQQNVINSLFFKFSNLTQNVRKL